MIVLRLLRVFLKTNTFKPKLRKNPRTLKKLIIDKNFVNLQTNAGKILIPNRFFNMPLFEPVIIDELDLLQINDSNVNLKILFKQFENDFIKQGSLIKI